MLAAIQPNLWMVTPFVGLLAAMAMAPLLFAQWWSRHYAKFTLALAGVTLAFYVLGLGAQERTLQTARDYVSFICLIGALFVISGGIHINVKGEASPGTNVMFLLVGALIANVLGTTGASMLLIRPWLRMNKYRLTAHHVVFFIFIVSNVGGSLTPVGDPPLFLGYLKGVPFWWVVQQCWLPWLVGVGLLLVVFFLLDTRNFRRAPRAVRDRETAHEQWRFEGLVNLLFLGIVLGAVFIKQPTFLREGIMAAAAGASWLTTKKGVLEANDFSFQPIKEVAVLFLGIFATMMPALDWLQASAARFGEPSPALFFWGSGALSSVLDNAPTYLSFLSTAFGAFASPDLTASLMACAQGQGLDTNCIAATHYAQPICQAAAAFHQLFPKGTLAANITYDQAQTVLLLANPWSANCLRAISIGSVFFGANTYIGNGPNLLVKAIADQQKAHTPAFFGYIFRFTLPCMLPMLVIVWLLFFRS